MEKLEKKIESAAEVASKDSYIESLYMTLEVCDLVIQNSASFPFDQVEKARKLKYETVENIKKREAIIERA